MPALTQTQTLSPTHTFSINKQTYTHTHTWAQAHMYTHTHTHWTNTNIHKHTHARTLTLWLRADGCRNKYEQRYGPVARAHPSEVCLWTYVCRHIGRPSAAVNDVSSRLRSSSLWGAPLSPLYRSVNQVQEGNQSPLCSAGLKLGCHCSFLS